MAPVASPPEPRTDPAVAPVPPGLVGRTVAAAALSTVLATLPAFLLGGLAVLVRDDLGFSEVQLGLAASAFFTVAAMSSVPAGRIAARLGAWATTVLAAGASSVSLLATSLAPSYAVLLAALAVGGVGNALAQIGTNGALAAVVPASRQGLAFGVKQAAVPAATLLAGFALPLVGLTLGWRASFAGAALLALVYLGLAPRAKGVRAAGRRAGGRAGDAAVRALVVVALAASLSAAAANGLAAFLVESAVTAGFSVAGAGVLLGCGSALGVAARVAVGWLADRRERGHLALVAGMMAVGAGGMALLATGAGSAFLLGTALVFAFGWSWPGLMTYAVVRLNPAAPAVATSYTQTGVFAGGAVGPVAFGLLVHAGSYRLAWSVAAGAMLTAAGLMVAGRRMLLAGRRR